MFFCCLSVRVRGYPTGRIPATAWTQDQLDLWGWVAYLQNKGWIPSHHGSVDWDPLRSGKQSLDSHPFLTTTAGFAREVLLWNRMKAKSFVTKDLVTLGIYQFDSSRLAWSTKIHCGHSNLTSPRRKVQEAPCWCGDFSPNHERKLLWTGPFPFQNLPLKIPERCWTRNSSCSQQKRIFSHFCWKLRGFEADKTYCSCQCDFANVPFTIHSKNMSLLSFRNLPWISRNHEKKFGVFFLLATTKHTHLQHVKKSLGPRLDQVRQLLQSCMKFSGGSKVGYILSINFRGEIADLFR